MSIHRSLIGLFIFLAGLLGACGAEEPAVKKQLELEFVSHITAELPEQDVFVAKTEGGSDVYRIDGSAIADFKEAPVYAAREAIEHDPFVLGEEPFGPFPKGAFLGFTLEEWLAGTGHGTYTIQEDQAELDITFENLVPHGVYTVWCPIIHLPPDFKIIDEPCGAKDGSENIFVTNAQGKARFHLHLHPLPDSTDQVLRMVAIAYHSDGKTYGAVPGDFGLNTHVQIFFGLPPVESEAWQTVSGSELATARQ